MWCTTCQRRVTVESEKPYWLLNLASAGWCHYDPARLHPWHTVTGTDVVVVFPEAGAPRAHWASGHPHDQPTVAGIRLDKRRGGSLAGIH